MHLHLLSAISTSIIELVGLEVVAMATKFMVDNHVEKLPRVEGCHWYYGLGLEQG
jgi:hypothetical protein